MLTRPGVTSAPPRSTLSRPAARRRRRPRRSKRRRPGASRWSARAGVVHRDDDARSRRALSTGRRGARVRLPLAGLGLADEGGLVPELLDRRRVDVAHPAAEAAVELLHDLGDRAAQRELHLLALGHVLVERVAAALDREPRRRRRSRRHAPVHLEQLAPPADDVAGALVPPGEQATHHHRARARPDRGRDVARAADPTVRDQRDAGLAGRRGAIEHCQSCGTPTPATSRVVQAKPGPIPTLTASAPAAARSRTPSPVATLPATTSTPGQAPFSSPRPRSQHPHAHGRCRGRARPPPRRSEPARSR